MELRAYRMSGCRTPGRNAQRSGLIPCSRLQLPASRQLCSGCGRWAPAGLVTLSDTKQSLGPATGAPASGGCVKYRGRWTRTGRPAPCQRPLLYRPNSRSRPTGVGQSTRLGAAKPTFTARFARASHGIWTSGTANTALGHQLGGPACGHGHCLARPRQDRPGAAPSRWSSSGPWSST
jgi:hypothetical protein